MRKVVRDSRSVPCVSTVACRNVITDYVPPVALRVVPDTMFSSGGGDPLPGRHIVHREIAADDPVTVQVQKAARVFGTRPMFTAH